MPPVTTVILSNGGLRSLVAAAVALTGDDRPKAAILHLREDRPAAAFFADHAKRQAEFCGAAQFIELHMPKPARPAAVHEPAADLPLARIQRLTIALGRAIELQAEHLIWPVQVNADFAAIARITEQTVLLRHMAGLEAPQLPNIETPLLELTDRQLIELGGQMDLPWHLARTCPLKAEDPCRVCPACRRRRAAFDAAGMIDPIDQPTPTH